MRSKVYVAPRRKSARKRKPVTKSLPTMPNIKPQGRARTPATPVAFPGLRFDAVTRALLRLVAAIRVLTGYLAAVSKLVRLMLEIKRVAPPDNKIVAELLKQLGSLRLMGSVDDLDVAIGYVSAVPIIVGLFAKEEKTQIGKMASELVGILSWLQKNMLIARGGDNK